LTLIGEPGSRLLNNPGVHAEVEDRALSGNALTVEDVELGDLERRRDLILDDLQPGAVTHHILAVLQCLDAADVAANGGVELQGLTAGGRLRGTEHHADLLTQLVNEDRSRTSLVQRASHLAKGLAHQPSLDTH